MKCTHEGYIIPSCPRFLVGHPLSLIEEIEAELGRRDLHDH